MTIIDALIGLQDVDGQIRELETELKDLPQRKAQETARLSGVSMDLQAAKALLEQTNQRVRGYEEEAKTLEAKIQQLRIAQTSLKTNKEYAQYSMQIDLVEHDKEAADANQVAALDDVPLAQSRVAEAQGKFDAEKSVVDAFCADIDSRIAAVERDLADAKAKREEAVKAVSAIDPKFLLYYERLRTKRWPVVAVLTHDGVCDGCHLVQPPSVGQLADANAKNGETGKEQRIVACTMCGRILYRC